MPSEVLPGDLVLVAAHGRVFYARVLGRERLGRFRLAPLDPSVRAPSAKLRDITDHWSHRGDPRPARPARTQASFDHLVDR
jgi:hypothetical protein